MASNHLSTSRSDVLYENPSTLLESSVLDINILKLNFPLSPLASTQLAKSEPYAKLPPAYDWHTIKKQQFDIEEMCQKYSTEKDFLVETGRALWSAIIECIQKNSEYLDYAREILSAQQRILIDLREDRRGYMIIFKKMNECNRTIAEIEDEINGELRSIQSLDNDRNTLETSIAHVKFSINEIDSRIQVESHNLVELQKTDEEIALILSDIDEEDRAHELLQPFFYYVLTRRGFNILLQASRRSKLMRNFHVSCRKRQVHYAFKTWDMWLDRQFQEKSNQEKQILNKIPELFMHWKLYASLQKRFRNKFNNRMLVSVMHQWKLFATNRKNIRRFSLRNSTESDLLRKILYSWRDFSKKPLNLMVSDRILLDRVIHRWYMYTMGTKDGNFERVQLFRCRKYKRTISRVFYAWAKSCSRRKYAIFSKSNQKLRKEMPLIEPNKTSKELDFSKFQVKNVQLNPLWEWFNTWRKMHSQFKCIKNTYKISVDYYKYTVCTKSLCLWGTYSKRSLQREKKKLNQAIAIRKMATPINKLYMQIQCDWLNKWKNIYLKEIQEERLIRIIGRKVRHRLLGSIFRSWFRYRTLKLVQKANIEEEKMATYQATFRVKNYYEKSLVEIQQKLSKCKTEVEKIKSINITSEQHIKKLKEEISHLEHEKKENTLKIRQNEGTKEELKEQLRNLNEIYVQNIIGEVPKQKSKIARKRHIDAVHREIEALKSTTINCNTEIFSIKQALKLRKAQHRQEISAELENARNFQRLANNHAKNCEILDSEISEKWNILKELKFEIERKNRAVDRDKFDRNFRHC